MRGVQLFGVVVIDTLILCVLDVKIEEIYLCIWSGVQLFEIVVIDILLIQGI